MTTLLLLIAVTLVGLFWIGGIASAASHELSDPARRRAWIAAAVTLFLALVGVNLALAASGIVARFDRFPPPMVFYFLGMIAVAFAVAFSRFGTLLARQTPLSWLVGFQSFRILAEAVLFTAHRAGMAPVQMTFEGYNFDIVTGVTAIAVGLWLHRRPSVRLAQAWNWMGLAFLLVIAFLANTSMPTPLRIFPEDQSNVWVTGFPYLLLPGVLVVAALSGHLVTFRKLAMLRQTGERPIQPVRS